MLEPAGCPKGLGEENPAGLPNGDAIELACPNGTELVMLCPKGDGLEVVWPNEMDGCPKEEALAKEVELCPNEFACCGLSCENRQLAPLLHLP